MAIFHCYVSSPEGKHEENMFHSQSESSPTQVFGTAAHECKSIKVRGSLQATKGPAVNLLEHELTPGMQHANTIAKWWKHTPNMPQYRIDMFENENILQSIIPVCTDPWSPILENNHHKSAGYNMFTSFLGP